MISQKLKVNTDLTLAEMEELKRRIQEAQIAEEENRRQYVLENEATTKVTVAARNSRQKGKYLSKE